jgi:hypothetical protein
VTNQQCSTSRVPEINQLIPAADGCGWGVNNTPPAICCTDLLHPESFRETLAITLKIAANLPNFY